jgi:hypothetical protein
MGAWGSGAFENDDASDRVYELEQRGIEAVVEALAPAPGDGYLEAPDGVLAIAAAEVVAAIGGAPAEDLPEEVLAVVERGLRIDRDVYAAAVAAIARVLGPESELRDLWMEAESGDEWRRAVAALRRRLAAIESTIG